MNPATRAGQVTHRQVWLLAGPIILSNISVPLVGAVDTAVVGQLPGPEPIGAVALGALIFSFLYWGFGFLRMGTTAFAAQAYGRSDQRELGDTLLRVALLALVFGLLSIVLAGPLISMALYFIDSGAGVERLTSDYAHIRIWSAPAVLGVYAMTGFFIGIHNTTAVLVIQLVLNLTNIGLNLVFVLGLGWGVEGVALASVIAEYLALAVGCFWLRHRFSRALAALDPGRLLNREAVVLLFQANFNIFIRTLCLVYAFAYFTASGAALGDIILAANAILMHFLNFTAYALDGFAHAAEALAGSAYGAGKKAQFRRAVWLTTAWSVLVAVLACLVFFLFGESIIDVFTADQAIADTARHYLPWMMLAPIVSVWSFQIDGIFIGTGHTRAMRNAMLVSVLVYMLLLQYLVPNWGNHGLYFGLGCFLLLRALSLLWFYPGIETALRLNRQRV